MVAYFKSILLDDLDDVLEEHLGRERVAVVDDWLSVGSVPAVQLHAAAALHQRSANVHRTATSHLTHTISTTVDFSGTFLDLLLQMLHYGTWH